MSRPRHRARPRRSLVSRTIAVALLLGVQLVATVSNAAAPVDSPGPASADGVVPTIVDTASSNDDCGLLGFDHGISVNGNGQGSGGGLTVTVSGYNSPTGFLDWSSSAPILAVYVKGGPSGGDLFSYPAGDTGDQDLHTPRKPVGGFYGVSHAAFCWNDVTPVPDVTIVKQNDPVGVVIAGDTITYTLTVTNGGTATASNVVVTDPLPVGVTFVDATSGCNETAGLVTCNLGDIGAGADLSVEITVTVDEESCGSIENVAHVEAADESGAALENNGSNSVTNEASCEQPSPPDLQVTKSSDADGILHEGDSFLYTITVTNVGDEAATGVSFLDVLPEGALNVAIPPFPTFAGDACTVTSSSPAGGGLAHTEIACGPVSLAPGASASVTVKVIVTGEVCGAVANVVDVGGTNEPEEAVGPDNHAEAGDEIACVPRIRLQKGGPARAHVGDEITYVFGVKNTGGLDLTGIDLTDPKCASTPTRTDDGDGDDALAVGETWMYECSHTITAGDGDPVHNVATVTGHHGEGGSVSDTDDHDVQVLHPSIDLEKSADPPSGSPGTTITYAYSVENTGDATLFDVSVDDDQLGHIGTIASLAPGHIEQLTAEITLGDSPVTNIATAEGADALGGSVSDVDEATVTIVGAGAVGGAGGGGSPFTGRDVDGLLGWLLGLLALGSSLLIGSRRRAEGR
jgi:uncharacterized repeat protein (TIGR01451 family)